MKLRAFIKQGKITLDKHRWQDYLNSFDGDCTIEVKKYVKDRTNDQNALYMPVLESAAAVKAAYEYLLKVSPDAGRFSNFRVEEISSDPGGDGSYLITLSYEIAGDFGFDKKKEYKDFKVQNDSTVAWMKIRII